MHIKASSLLCELLSVNLVSSTLKKYSLEKELGIKGSESFTHDFPL